MKASVLTDIDLLLLQQDSASQSGAVKYLPSIGTVKGGNITITE